MQRCSFMQACQFKTVWCILTIVFTLHLQLLGCCPYRVTELVIKKPDNWRHSPGDWVFIRVPKIAHFERHPFTVSSAPETPDTFALHIRGVGTWTNRLYKYYEETKVKSTRVPRGKSTER